MPPLNPPSDENRSTILRLLENKHSKVISHAFKAIRTHPLPKALKRLRIRDRYHFLTPHRPAGIAEEATRLFKLIGLLEEWILDIDDLRPFLSPFLDSPKFQVLSQPHAFPSIKRVRCTIRACGFPYEVPSCGHGGEAETMGRRCAFLWGNDFGKRSGSRVIVSVPVCSKLLRLTDSLARQTVNTYC